MTYQDIYNKFMIEYDKADVSSSYPSFTEYEICTFLDKAYLAVIAQKVGHLPSQSMLIEQDPKSIHELSHLYDTTQFYLGASRFSEFARNSFYLDFQGELFNFEALYILNAKCEILLKRSHDEPEVILYSGNVKPVSIEVAQKSFETSSNYPRLKQPLLIVTEYDSYGDEKFVIVVDPTLADVIREEHFDNENPRFTFKVFVEYIEYPDSFNDNLDNNHRVPDKLASEIISTAVIMALENIESPRMQTKAQLKQLEA